MLFGPLAPATHRWALREPRTRAKAVALRRIVVPAVAAAGKDYERDVPAGFRFGGNARDLLELFVYLFGVWEPNLTAFLTHRLSAGDTFVDVGANSGWFTMLAAQQVGPSGQVVAIEASPHIAERLRANIARNDLRNVRVLVSAAGREAGEVEVVLGPAEHTGLTKVHKADGHPGSGALVPCDTLPQLLTEAELASARVVKIDVEGAEFDVVAGLAEAVDRFRADCEFVVEVGPRRASSPELLPALMATFTDRGFIPYVLPNAYQVGNYLLDASPTALARLDGLPHTETDVVFSRIDAPQLVL